MTRFERKHMMEQGSRFTSVGTGFVRSECGFNNSDRISQIKASVEGCTG